MSLIRELKDVKRFEHIINVLFACETGYLLHELKLKKHLPFHKQLQTRKFAKEDDVKLFASKLRKAFENLGPTFIKLGQLLSLRPDLIPGDFCEEFRKLQDRVPPFPFQYVKKTIEAESKAPISKTFPTFDKIPIASASIAQVHKAKLRNGKKVAVKIQRPKIREIIVKDIDILYFFAHLMERNDKFRDYNPVTVVREFEDYTLKELDFEHEAMNAERFYKNFKDSKSVYIPKVYPECSSKRMLTLEFLDGIELNETDKIKKKHVNTKRIALNGVDSILKQIFEFGFFHADSHPGNIFVLDNKKIAYVDFGIVGEFTDDLREKVLRLFIGVVDKDVNNIVNILVEICDSDNLADLNEYKKEINEIIAQWHGSTLKEMRITTMITKIINTCVVHRMKVPAEITLFGKALVTIEGTALELYPEFNLIDRAKPFIEKVLEKQYGPGKLLERVTKEAADIEKLLTKLPEQTSRILEKIDRGDIELKVDRKEFQQYEHEQDRMNRIKTIGILAAALIIGSSIILQTEGRATVFGLSIGIIQLLIAIVLCIWLIMLILKKGIKGDMNG